MNNGRTEAANGQGSFHHLQSSVSCFFPRLSPHLLLAFPGSPLYVRCDELAPFNFLPRKTHWSGLPLPSPEDLSDPGIEPAFLALAGGFFTTESPGKPIIEINRLGKVYDPKQPC